MFRAFEFCLPTLGKSVPARSEWLHEIKYDGYRVRLERDGDRVRLITKGGYDLTRRYPASERPHSRTGAYGLTGKALQPITLLIQRRSHRQSSTGEGCEEIARLWSGQGVIRLP
jgi:hypothetical protein